MRHKKYQLNSHKLNQASNRYRNNQENENNK